jgi:periplasmic protein TonB
VIEGLMPPSKEEHASSKLAGHGDPSRPFFRAVELESGSLFTSLWTQIKELGHGSKLTACSQYYRGETRLPVSEMGNPFISLIRSVRSLFEKPEPPSIPITSQPIEVPDIWQDYKPQWYSGVNSLLIIAILLAMVIMPSLVHVQPMTLPNQPQLTQVMLNMPDVDMPPALKKAGGGGGGDRSPTPATKGEAPKFAWRQLAPPVAKLTITKPKLPVTPTLLGPPQIKLPEVAMNVWGNPNGVPGPPSMGQGNGTGIGPGSGGGFGPGSGGSYGGGVFQVGGDVTKPIAIYAPEPQYSERAREAKYQGTDVLSIIVTADGGVEDVQVVRPLGLGLDQNAIKTVKTWKFRPAMRNGHPVPVQVEVEVTFRLF